AAAPPAAAARAAAPGRRPVGRIPRIAAAAVADLGSHRRLALGRPLVRLAFELAHRGVGRLLGERDRARGAPDDLPDAAQARDEARGAGRPLEAACLED